MMRDLTMSGTPGTIRDDDVPPVHRETLRSVLSILREVPIDRISLELVRLGPDCSKLLARPSNDQAAEVTVLFWDEDDPRKVGVAAGEAAFVSLHTDIYGHDARHWREFLTGFVCGVLAGTLVERLAYRSGRLVKSNFTVRVGQEPFSFSRRSLPNLLRGMFKKREERTVSYGAYVAD